MAKASYLFPTSEDQCAIRSPHKPKGLSVFATVMEANKALKEAVNRIVINPETGLLLHWHHAPKQPTDAGPFQSRHYTAFDPTNPPGSH